MISIPLSNDERKLFSAFAQQEKLTVPQTELFERYLELLRTWNEDINLTALVDVRSIISYHFQDSVRLKNFMDFTTSNALADVGAGAGFPSIPLKIMYPHLKVVLIEVTKKKVQFLQTVIDQLSLENVEVYSLDWRTFLRKTEYAIDLFVSRAALAPEELLRMFKPSCIYNKALLVYWASRDWRPSDEEKPYIVQEHTYKIQHKTRRFIVFQKR